MEHMMNESERPSLVAS
jgi:hypothetical protein